MTTVEYEREGSVLTILATSSHVELKLSDMRLRGGVYGAGWLPALKQQNPDVLFVEKTARAQNDEL